LPHDRVAPVGPDLHVERGLRCGVERRPDQLPYALCGFDQLARRAYRVRRRLDGALRQIESRAYEPPCAGDDELRGCGLGMGSPRLGLIPELPRGALEVE